MFWILKWFWRIYFFAMVYLFFRLTFANPLHALEDWIDVGMMAFSLAALFGFAFQVRMLSVRLWKLFFFTLVLWDFYYHFLVQPLGLGIPPQLGVIVLLTGILPLYIGVFCYAFFPPPKPGRKGRESGEVSWLRPSSARGES